MWPEVEHRGRSDVATAGEEPIERRPAIGSGVVVDTTTWAIDVFATDDVTLGSETFDFLFDEIVDSVVIARQKRVTPFLLL